MAGSLWACDGRWEVGSFVDDMRMQKKQDIECLHIGFSWVFLPGALAIPLSLLQCPGSHVWKGEVDFEPWIIFQVNFGVPVTSSQGILPTAEGLLQGRENPRSTYRGLPCGPLTVCIWECLWHLHSWIPISICVQERIVIDAQLNSRGIKRV